jgi:hypothetical protein
MPSHSCCRSAAPSHTSQFIGGSPALARDRIAKLGIALDCAQLPAERGGQTAGGMPRMRQAIQSNGTLLM